MPDKLDKFDRIVYNLKNEIQPEIEDPTKWNKTLEGTRLVK